MTISQSDWLKALSDVGAIPVNDHPDAVSATELAKLWGCSETTSRVRLNKLTALGRAKKYTRRIGRNVAAVYLLVKKG